MVLWRICEVHVRSRKTSELQISLWAYVIIWRTSGAMKSILRTCGALKHKLRPSGGNVVNYLELSIINYHIYITMHEVWMITDFQSGKPPWSTWVLAISRLFRTRLVKIWLFWKTVKMFCSDKKFCDCHWLYFHEAQWSRTLEKPHINILLSHKLGNESVSKWANEWAHRSAQAMQAN